VMYAGQIVEEATIRDLYYRPQHPYSSALLAAMPQQVSRDQAADLASIPGSPPAPGTFPVGCRFHPRCEYARDKCAQGEVGDLIRLRELANGQTSRCVRVDEIELQGAR
jgi:peptide/nickel transport system ATP-binding protein